ncbi:MAG: glutaredoxin [Bacteroidota bacterium]
MNSKVIIILLCLFSSQLYAQAEKILITEKKRGKRVVLEAENVTSDTLNVFFMVNSNGYRRSADKPILKDIPPQTKVKMMTLIELTNVESNYTYELILNDKNKPKATDYNNKIVDIENVIKGRLVVFTTRNCEKCKNLLSQLSLKHVPYQSFDIATEPLRYRQFMKHIEGELTGETRISFPIIWNKDHTIFGYDVLETILEKLTK